MLKEALRISRSEFNTLYEIVCQKIHFNQGWGVILRI